MNYETKSVVLEVDLKELASK